MLKDLKKKFVLQTKRVEGEAPIYFRALRKFNGKKVDKLINTQVLVDIHYFRESYAKAISMDDADVPEHAKFIYDQLSKVCNIFDNLDSNNDFDKDFLDAEISKVVVGKSYQTVQLEKQMEADAAQRMAEELRIAEEAKKEEIENPLLFLSRLIDDISAGVIVRKGKPLAANTIKAWISFQGVLTGFYSKYPFSFSNVDESLVCRFMSYLRDDCGYMLKTQNKYLMTFHALCVRASNKGVMDKNQLIAFEEKQAVVKESDKAKEIYLTTDEIQALYEMKLTGLQDKVRDIFLVGYYTAQRFSDYSKLDEDNFTTTAKGTKVVKLIQQKTGNSVTIPILSDNLISIAKKYNYDLPILSDVVFNRYIKEILKQLSESVPSLGKKEVTLLTLRERKAEEAGKMTFLRDKKGRVIKPRYDLVSSHTARRSGITNLVLAGKFNTFQIMSISGHRDRKSFAEYIKLSSDELADEIMKKSANENVF